MIKYSTPLVEIVWHDAATPFGWEHEDKTDTSEEPMITIGFIIAKKEHTVIITSSINNTTGKINNSRIKIPIGMIKSIKELNVSYKRTKKEQEVQT